MQKDDPNFQPNPDFLRDMFNIVVGIAWQTSLVAFPIYIVIRRIRQRRRSRFGIVIVTSLILKFTWYNHLRKMEVEVPIASAPPVVAG